MNPTTLPGNALPDLLTGWVGPVLVLEDSKPWAYDSHLRGLHRVHPPTTGQHPIIHEDDDFCRLYNVRLDLTRSEALSQALLVLARGMRCSGFPGCSNNIECPVSGWSCPGCVDCYHPMPTVVCACAGTGYLRKPAPAYHLVTAEFGGQLPAGYAEHSAALVACHATRVAAGILGPQGFRGVGGIRSVPAEIRRVNGAWVTDGFAFNTVDEAEQHRRQWCDSKLAAGFAMVETDGTLRLPGVTL